MKTTALITGAASGIGKEFSRIHAAKGGDIVAVDMNAEGLKSLKSELENQFGTTVYTIVKNLTELSAPQEIYDELKNSNIKIDYLINNAGFGGVGAFHERNWNTDLAMIQVNVLALTALTRQFLPDFIARDSGKILNVSSTVSLIPGPFQAVYFATKAFVTSFNRSIYGELSGTNVSSTAVLPGATKTAFGDHSGMNKTAIYKKPASAADVALEGYNAMEKGEVEVIAGLGFNQRLELRLAPFLSAKSLINRIKKQSAVN
ncbi:SDR family oxidoreductase [Winogradskyella sp.]|uniref:SDR family NAD(P)-dependent oxidoreductase n=1 Tax=Winogradskyella sp. TaxID=1883156 RepID=UPI00261E3E29|nr:SDR family NAD(P)-dependent oxidoreductase [Winogradskyella sp.]